MTARLSRRAGIGLAAIVGLLLLLLICGEALGWRFLRGFVEQRISAAAHAEARIEAPFRLYLLTGPRVSAQAVRIAAQPDSGAPFLLEASGLAAQARWGDLLRAWRGQPLRLKSVAAERLEAHLRRVDADTASWHIGPRDAEPAQPTAVPSAERLALGDAQIHVDDAVLGLQLEVRARTDAPAPARPGEATSETLEARATGRYRKLPVEASVDATGLAGAAAGAEGSRPRIEARARIGDASVRYDGTVDPEQRGANGDFRFEGLSLAAIGEPLGVTLPTTGPVALAGHVERRDAAWQVRVDEAKVGRTSLQGTFAYEPTRAPPLLTGQLRGPRLSLVDLGPAIGARTDAQQLRPARPADADPARVLPQRDFDIPSLRAMDADVRIDLGELDLNTSALEPLRPLKGRLTLKGGVLRLDDLDARMAGGAIRGAMSYDGTKAPPRWAADLRLAGVDLAGWIRGVRQDDAKVTARSSASRLKGERQKAAAGTAPVRSLLTGELELRLDLSGAGTSTADILASLDGNALAVVRNGTVSHLVVEFGGIDLAEGLGMFVKGDETLPLTCALAAMEARQGVLRPKAAVLDTQDSTVVVTGSIDLRSEALDLRAVVHPKDFTVFSLRSPLNFRGTLGDPRVTAEPAPIAGRVAAAAALSLLNPFAALIPFIDSGDSVASQQCRDAVREADRVQREGRPRRSR